MRPTTRSLNPPPSSPQQPADRLAHYILIKMTLSGDYLAKDKLGDTFLLCSSRRKIKQQTLPQITGAYLLESVQVIQEEGNCYQVFQLTQKLFWAGDHTNMANKSQLQCLSLLYSAVKNIVKPLVQHGSAFMTSYISLENLWFRDTRCYLLMCKRSKNKNIFKTQHAVRTLPVSGAQNKEAVMVSKLGEVFWDAFYPGEEGVESSNNNFRLILKAMIKGQLSLSGLLSVMEEKAAKKKFIAHHRSKQLPQAVDISSAMSTTEHESIYQRIENMPMSVGRRTLFFKSNNKSRQEGRSRYSRKGRTSVDLSENISPPSFSKGKRSKRYSLFSGTKHQSHTIGDDSFTRNLKISIPAEFQKRYTRTIDVSQDKEQASYFLNKNRSTFNKERRQLRSLFDEMKSNKLMAKVSRYERLESNSEQKALNKFKSIFETSRGSESKIDDNDFKQSIKQKSFYRRQNINQVIKQASKAIQKGEEQMSLHLNMKSVQLSNCMEDKEAGLEKYQKKRSGEVKVYNENIVDNKKQGSFHRLELPKENYYFSHPIEEQRSGNVSGMFSKQILKSIPSQHFNGSDSKFNRQKSDDNFSVEFLKPIEKNQQRDVLLEDLHKDQRREENRQKSKTERSELVRKQEENKLQKARKEEEIKKKQREERQRQNQMRKDIQEAVRKELKAERKKEEEDKVKAQKKDYYSDRRDIADEDIPAAAPSTFVIKKRQNAQNQQKKQLTKANKMNDKQQKISRNIFSRPDDYEDQIEEIQLTSQPKINQKNSLKQPIKSSPTQSHSQNMLQQQKQIKAPQNPPNPPKQSHHPRKNSAEEVKQQQQSRKGSQRVKTGQSAGSQQGPKGVRKQIDQYMYMVNKMGEAVAKSGKLSKKLEHVDWYVGVYFLYKRFYYERKKIQKYLIEQLPKLTRRGTINLQDWKEWLVKGQRDTLLNKCQDDNRNIEASLKKMAKKMDNMSLAASIALNIPITKNLSESSMLAIEHIMNEYDQLVQLKLLDDPDIYIHINEMINALWVMSELDGKIEEKKSVLQYGNVKRTPSELNSLVKTILNFYYEQQQ